MLVDVERVLVEVKALIAAKPSHGARELLADIGRLEAQYRIDPDEYEAWARRFGHHLVDTALGLVPGATSADHDPLTGAAVSAPAMDESPHLRSATDSEASSWKQRQQLVASVP